MCTCMAGSPFSQGWLAEEVEGNCGGQRFLLARVDDMHTIIVVDRSFELNERSRFVELQGST
jgi:hypothetical protein